MVKERGTARRQSLPLRLHRLIDDVPDDVGNVTLPLCCSMGEVLRVKPASIPAATGVVSALLAYTLAALRSALAKCLP